MMIRVNAERIFFWDAIIAFYELFNRIPHAGDVAIDGKAYLALVTLQLEDKIIRKSVSLHELKNIHEHGDLTEFVARLGRQMYREIVECFIKPVYRDRILAERERLPPARGRSGWQHV
jgi:hypothetical protein